MDSAQDSHSSRSSLSGLVGLALAALGIVYGDIGTSPLYALKEIFFGKGKIALDVPAILGVTSTVFWALTLIVTVKYVLLVLRADHEKEGGVFALYGLLQQLKIRHKAILLGLLVLAAGLLFGDGIITPAISVISSVEGLEVVAPQLVTYVIPVTLFILTGLFAVQKNGTSRIGALFGPIMLIWFFVIGALGLSYVTQYPTILLAINPLYMAHFIMNYPFHELLVILGFVMLVVTGGEAMYADLGHFGRTSIRLSWLIIAYPMLVLNYFGQGAYLLSGRAVLAGSIFYSMAPSWGLLPLIILAAAATIIASQALITGAYSLAAQAYSLRLLPYLPTRHTHVEHEGQIYIPLINASLYVGCVLLVLAFRSSDNLASAYGLAVSGVMLVTTLSVAVLARFEWHWPLWLTALVFVPFGIIDSVFVVANSLKFMAGGYVPLSIGLSLLLIMNVWKWGITFIDRSISREVRMTVADLLTRRNKTNAFTPNTTVIVSHDFVTDKTAMVPPLHKLYLDKYALLPNHLVFLSVRNHHEPSMARRRFTIVPLDVDPDHGTIVSVQINFGFMEDPVIEPYLRQLIKAYPQVFDTDTSKWVFHVVHPRVLTNGTRIFWKRFREQFFKFLHRTALSDDEILGLGKRYHLTAEVVPVLIK